MIYVLPEIDKNFQRYLASNTPKIGVFNSFSAEGSDFERIRSMTLLRCSSGFTHSTKTKLPPLNSAFEDLFKEVNFIYLHSFAAKVSAFAYANIGFIYNSKHVN